MPALTHFFASHFRADSGLQLNSAAATQQASCDLSGPRLHRSSLSHVGYHLVRVCAVAQTLISFDRWCLLVVRMLLRTMLMFAVPPLLLLTSPCPFTHLDLVLHIWARMR